MANPFAAVAFRAVSTAEGKSDSWQAKQRAVFAACKRLGLDADARRDIQLGVTGKASMSDMDLGELGKVLDTLNRDYKGPAGHGAHAGKIRALWWTLYWIGAVTDPKGRAIDAFIRRQTGVTTLRFLDHRRGRDVIEALKSWAAREGVIWPIQPDELGDRQAVIDAIWAKLRRAGLVSERTPTTYVTASLAIPAPDVRAWSRHELDAAIRLLGKRLRRDRGREGDQR